MANLNKISNRTRNLYRELQNKLKGTKEQYRYSLGVNGRNEVCFTDFRTMTDVKGNRTAQATIKTLLES